MWESVPWYRKSRRTKNIGKLHLKKPIALFILMWSYPVHSTVSTGCGMPSPARPLQSSYFTDTCWQSKVWRISMSGLEAFLEPINHCWCQTYKGNDVASGLKWMLASNSVVFMPLPRVETWAMESLLQVCLRKMMRGVKSCTAYFLTPSPFSTALGALCSRPPGFFGPAG